MSACEPAAEYLLRLYVTGTTRQSARAIANTRSFCEECLAGRYRLEVIDIYQNPEAVSDHAIVAAPTLVRVLPAPSRRVTGDMSDRERIIAGIDASVDTGRDADDDVSG